MILNNVFSLEELSFIAGDFYSMEFTVYVGTGSELYDTNAPFYFDVCVLGEPDEIVLSKVGTYLSPGHYLVNIDSTDTINLGGKYVYQPWINVNAQQQYRPAQGILTIIPAIK